MSSHASQPPSSCARIPPALFDQYIQYKSDTRVVLSWLSANGGNNSANQSLTINQITHLGEIVKRKGICMPEIIAYRLRESISARTQFSNFFRGQNREYGADKSTICHEFFTAR